VFRVKRLWKHWHDRRCAEVSAFRDAGGGADGSVETTCVMALETALEGASGGAGSPVDGVL
jgi:hypothetical protein